MPTYDYNALITDAATVVAAVWTDVVPNGIWELDEAIRQSWEERIMPFAVFELEPPEPTTEWGVVNNAHEVSMRWHYVALEAAGMAAVRTKLTALESAMFSPTAFVTSQATIKAETRLDWGPENPINSIAYAKNIPVCAGTLTLHLICGTSVF